MKNDKQEPLDNFFPGNEIYKFLNSMEIVTNSPLRIILLTKNFSFNLSQLNENLNSLGITFNVKSEDSNFKLWNISITSPKENEFIKCPHCGKKFRTDKDKKHKLENYMVEYIKHNTLIFISNDKENFEFFIDNFNHLYPLVSRIFYRTQDLRKILNLIADKKNTEVIGRKCVAKRLYTGKKTTVTYEEDTIEGFFESAKKENCWIDSVEVMITPLGVLWLSRKGTILYSSSFNFSGFFEIVVNTIINYLFNRREVLQNKSRTTQNPKIKPLVMAFDQNHFSDIENISKLVKRLNSVDDYEVGVFYMSKELAHIEVYDYANGSGMDLYINSSNKLKIVPQTQSTDIVLEGIILRINDIFEGEVAW